MNAVANKANHPSYSLPDLVLYFAKLGATGFGGPVALVGYMQRDLVETKKWFSAKDYKEGLTLAQLAPGPLAAQLAIYLGFIDFGILGATLAGFAFVLPSFLMVIALGWAYVNFEGLPWMQSVFYGVGAAVIGIIAYSAYKLTKRTVGKDWLLWIIYLSSAVVTAISEREMIGLILGAGILYWAYKLFIQNRWLTKLSSVLFVPLGLIAETPAAGSSSWSMLWSIFVFFAKAGTFVFGSGLAIVPFLYGGVVGEHHWLDDRQFLDAVAVAMITPGPIVITVGFIGYIVAGLLGAIVAAVGVFLPCYLFTIIPAPYFRKYGQRPAITAFVDGITAAAIGAITGAVVVLGRRSIVDVPTALLALGAVFLLIRAKRIPEPLIVLLAAGIGFVVR